DQRRGRLELARGLGDFLRWQEQEAVPGKEFAGTQRLHRLEILGVGLELFGQRIGGGASEFRRWRLDYGQDQFFAIESLLKLVVALAPVEIGRDQRIDVGIAQPSRRKSDDPARMETI